MTFNTYIPCPLLQPFVKTLAIQEMAVEHTYRVLPDTGIVIGFQYKGRLSRLDNGKETQLSTTGISGLSNQYKIFKNTPGIGTVLVRFKAAGAAPFFKQPLHEVFGESISLDNFMLRSELLALEEKLCAAADNKARIDIVEKFLLSRMTATQPDKLVLAALALIHKSKGNIRITELMQQLHTSQSPLERRFRQAVGASPKKFASIVRLKSALQQYKPGTSLTQLGYEAGFYDQAHFIKEFKSFTGQTPESYFRPV